MLDGVFSMSDTSPGYGITIRVEATTASSPTSLIPAAIVAAGGTLTALDVVESHHDRVVVDVTCDTRDANHADEIAAAISAASPNFNVKKVSDRTFLMHLGGKLEVASKVPLKTRDDLSRAYTPGVARICLAIAADKSDARRLTIKRNTVAVVSDGSAILGLGNLGPYAAMPVMEGKAVLFKRFANVDAWPICLDSQDTEEIIRAVQMIAPGFGGINLEDISAPRCFEIEARLKETLDIPVFHDDQHGTAIVVLAGLLNALRLVNKQMSEVRIVMMGAGAAGSAILRLLFLSGLKHASVFDSKGILHQGSKAENEMRKWLINNTNVENKTHSLTEEMKGADIFIGVSAPNVITEAQVESMAHDAIVFAMSNPDPEIDPALAQKHARIVATGRSDYPNQINNVLAFPGLFRGLLDAGVSKITDEMLVAGARAISECVKPEQLNENFIVPSVFDPAVSPAVSNAVYKIATQK
ncbi:MAG: malate dehydrogenase, partial [Actinobacteria bacterium]|jgi:malate dehydrogenase (oxaloacetate-decarboxylating)|nr:malate dehydrogenase [Actinomycetota bacterium]